MIRPFDDWNRFWFAPQTGRVLGLYRIAIGLLTVYSFSLWAKDAVVFFSDDGVLTTRTLQGHMGREYHTLLQWIGSPLGVCFALGALFAAALSFTVGLCTRVSSIVLYILVVSFHERNNLVLNGGDSVLRTMLFFFMFAPAGAAFSVDALRRRIRCPDAGPALVTPWAQRMMQVQVAVIYLVTAYAKSRGALYHEGTAMYYVFGLVDFNIRGVEQLMNYPIVYSSLTYAVLFTELALPFLLWFRVSRPYAVLLGILAHGWIILFMTIPVFGVLMLATYLPFFSEDELSTALERVRRRFERRRAKVFFDEACATCLKVRTLVSVLDLFGRVEALDARSVAPELLPPGWARRDVLEERVLVTPAGRVRTGFDAYRWLAARLPALAWSTPLWYLPGVAPLGRALYRRVARGRSLPARCPDSADCSVEESPLQG
jgi:predicted DCC family thiol-disulfide oxidoreductase YuxK